MSDLELLMKLLDDDEFDEIEDIFRATNPETRGEFMEILNSRLPEEITLLN